MTYFDKFGGLHLRPNPDPEQSENAPMYTGLWILLCFLLGELTTAKMQQFLGYCNALYYGDVNMELRSEWRTTPISESTRFSRDNFVGIVCGLLIIKWFGTQSERGHAKTLLGLVPVFHKQLDHPRDFMFVIMAKYPRTYIGISMVWWMATITLIIWLSTIYWWLGIVSCVWLLYLVPVIPQVACAVSCYQTHKTRGENKIAKTDGKILTFMMAQTMMALKDGALDDVWKTFWYFYEMMIEERDRQPPLPRNAGPTMGVIMKKNKPIWRWHTWGMLVFDYFGDSGHIIVEKMRRWQSNEGITD